MDTLDYEGLTAHLARLVVADGSFGANTRTGRDSDGSKTAKGDQPNGCKGPPPALYQILSDTRVYIIGRLFDWNCLFVDARAVCGTVCGARAADARLPSAASDTFPTR